MSSDAVQLDAVIFGGGVAGLWALDALTHAGHAAVLLEARTLGRGQTITSQGILHGGLKYTLNGVLNRAADAIRDMPAVWQAALDGNSTPDLSRTRVRAHHCHLWHTDTLMSRVGMVGARKGLRVRPRRVPRERRPLALAACPGEVFELPEQVISPASLLDDLARQHRARLLKINAESGLHFTTTPAGDVTAVLLINPLAGQQLELRPRFVILAAGAGNETLRARLQLPAGATQRRPLHMVLARGDLPELNGHCIDGARTRITVTTDRDHAGRRVWQIGGQVAEDGVRLSPTDLVRHVRQQVAETLPSLRLDRVEWSTYAVDRAEAHTPGRRRPEHEVILRDGNVLTAWPTKLVLAPRLAGRLLAELGDPGVGSLETIFEDWPRPPVADPPWEIAKRWYRDV